MTRWADDCPGLKGKKMDEWMDGWVHRWMLQIRVYMAGWLSVLGVSDTWCSS